MTLDAPSSPGSFTYRHRLKLAQTDAGGGPGQYGQRVTALGAP